MSIQSKRKSISVGYQGFGYFLEAGVVGDAGRWGCMMVEIHVSCQVFLLSNPSGGGEYTSSYEIVLKRGQRMLLPDESE